MWKRALALGLVLLGLCSAQCLALDAPDPFPVQEVAPGVYVFQAPYALAQRTNDGAIANAGFIVGADAVAVIDTEGSYRAGQRLRAAVVARTDRPIRYVINTHVHPDHTLGNAAFAGEGTTFVGHANLPEALTARAQGYLAAAKSLMGPEAFEGTRVVLPTTLVSDKLELELELGGRKLVLEAWKTAHTNTDLTVYDERTGTWFLGDLLFAGHVPALDGNLAGWLRVVADLKARPATRVVPGHGPASMPWPAAIAPMEAYLAGLEKDVRRRVREGQPIEDAAAAAKGSEPDGWALFHDFHPRNVTNAFHELEWE
jgi:quinoprotein relay system zinc metallohydrolase 2